MKTICWSASKLKTIFLFTLRNVWRYQRCNKNLYIEEEQTTQCQKKRETNHDLQYTTQKTKDRATLKTESELRCSGRVSRSCSTRGTHRVTLVISNEWGKNRIVITTDGSYSWSFDNFNLAIRYLLWNKSYWQINIYCYRLPVNLPNSVNMLCNIKLKLAIYVLKSVKSE